ncbi:hypothetical protein Poly51_42810 [Rubripirellula tenax]|uniref:Pycsar effector protein domain-containing protein n=1 Tax=Rubripirellula tenax TaxID=2528015 RepID=A0A5C6EQ00_9BACT|nr:hypothetical protein [Rubripirellula tenax]TWU50988.1 hypothetical protein Poly51_42810 [Rubripirellula tenax]
MEKSHEKENDPTTLQPVAETAAVQNPSSLCDDTQDALEAENLIETYQIIGEWIRFADAKAAAVLAVNGALCGVLIPTLHEYSSTQQNHPAAWWGTLVSASFLLWLVAMILSCVLAFRCILPFRHRGKHPAIGHADHFHPAAISQSYRIDQTEEFADEIGRMGMSGLKREIAICMMLDSHVSSAKYGSVSGAIRMLALSAVLGLLYMLSIQF